MRKGLLFLIVAASFMFKTLPAVADHMNGNYADNRGISISLRQSGRSVSADVQEPSGQRSTLNGQSDGGDYVSGRVQGAHQGNFELQYQQGNPGSIQIVVYDFNGNVLDRSVYYRVAGQQSAPPQLPAQGQQSPPANTGFGGGQTQDQGQQDQYQSQGQDSQQQQGADTQERGTESSLPVID